MEETQTSQGSAWQKHERNELLAIEKPEWRANRLEAENPNTPAATLARFADDALASVASVPRLSNSIIRRNQACLLVEALVAHPNTPTAFLIRLMGGSSYSARAFCRNPVAPLVLLETPDFAARLSVSARFALLREETAPVSLVQAISVLTDTQPEAAEEAWEVCLHLALAGEIQSRTEGEELFKRYWRGYFARIVHTRESAQRYCDLYELGLLPSWAEEPPSAMQPSAPKLTPEERKWLRFVTAPDSPEEQALWAEVVPDLAGRPDLAACLRQNAAEKDLITLVDLQDDESYLVGLYALITSHPRATPLIFERLLHKEAVNQTNEIPCIVAAHTNASTEQIAELVQCRDAKTRRLARRHFKAPPNAPDLSRQAALRYEAHHPTYGLFLGAALPLGTLESSGRAVVSHRRLIAALALPTRPVPFTGYEAEGCTSRDLLEHLARDGNRLVRWAAQTRLQDPDWVFTWQNDASNER